MKIVVFVAYCIVFSIKQAFSGKSKSATSKYGCRPGNLTLDAVPVSFAKAYPNAATVEESWKPDDPYELVLYSSVYPKISKDGVLPPKQDKVPNVNFVIYRFTVQFGQKSEYISLPYQYESGVFVTCLVYGAKDSPFFILEDFMNKGRAIKVEVKSDSQRREYVDLPYVSENNEVFAQRTFVVYTHKEKDKGPVQRFGYFEVSNEDPLPINAFKVFAINFPMFGSGLQESRTIKPLTNIQLVLVWNPGVCFKLVRAGNWVSRERCADLDFKIHTIWEGGEKDERLWNDASPQLLSGNEYDIKLMRKKWARTVVAVPIESQKKDLYFWSRLWLKYGQQHFKVARDYFSTAIKLYDKLKLGDLRRNMESANFFPSETHDYKREAFEKFLQSQFEDKKLKFYYILVSNDSGVLCEMRFCFKKDGDWKHISCPEVDPRANKEVKVVYFSRMFQASPYVVLTVAWKPSQLARLTYFRSGGAETGEPQVPSNRTHSLTSPEWKVHKFCPSFRYRFIILPFRDEIEYVLEPEVTKTYGSELKPLIEHAWPKLLDNVQYWYIEYTYCGLAMRATKISRVRGSRKYFSEAVHLYKNLMTQSWSRDKELSFDKPLNSDNVERRLSSLVGRKVGLLCFSQKESKGIPVLVKVNVCFENLNSLERRDCPDSLKLEASVVRKQALFGIPGGEVTECGKQLVIPSKPEKVSEFLTK